MDDCDAACSHAPDADVLRDTANKLFAQGNQQGIKVVDPGVMLGVNRTTHVRQGVRTVTLDQAAVIEGYWDKYKHLRRVKPPVQPYTTGDQHPMLSADGKVVGVSDQEAQEVQDLGYRKIVGEALWIQRNTGLMNMYATSMMSKCLCKPSKIAYNAALHAMHYMYANRHTGITYRSDGNLEPICFYDSGYNQKHLGTRPQYAYVIIWAGAAVVWKSKQHKSTPNSVSCGAKILSRSVCRVHTCAPTTEWARLNDLIVGRFSSIR
eukprot:COSAG01_NODE_377_length_17892_cov_207.715000_2_plen_264_part_00